MDKATDDKLSASIDRLSNRYYALKETAQKVVKEYDDEDHLDITSFDEAIEELRKLVTP